MAKVYPFRGLRYAPENMPIEQVVTQPYDKISAQMQERYYAMHPQNIVRIVLGKASPEDNDRDNVYTRAAESLREWRQRGFIEPLKSPAFVVYFQTFQIPGAGEQRVRKGFIGLGRLEDYANKVVFPHEKTLSGPKADRLQLLRHTKTHFEQIFMLYEDPEQRIDRVLDEVAQGKPDIDVKDEYGVTHTLWIVDKAPVLDLIQKEMADKRLIIADGHHRYETALAYRDEMRASRGNVESAAYERLSMTFFNMYSPGLTILPTHRVVSRLQDFTPASFLENARQFFDVVEAPAEAGQFRAELRKAGERQLTIGVCMDGGKRHVLLSLKPTLDFATIVADLSAKQRTLDVVVLHRLLIEKCLGISEEAVRKESNITYVREFDAALSAVEKGTAQVSFLLNATRMDQMRDIAYEGNVMPQKSTDFYPKVLSGLIMYSLEE